MSLFILGQFLKAISISSSLMGLAASLFCYPVIFFFSMFLLIAAHCSTDVPKVALNPPAIFLQLFFFFFSLLICHSASVVQYMQVIRFLCCLLSSIYLDILVWTSVFQVHVQSSFLRYHRWIGVVLHKLCFLSFVGLISQQSQWYSQTFMSVNLQSSCHLKI